MESMINPADMQKRDIIATIAMTPRILCFIPFYSSSSAQAIAQRTARFQPFSN